MKAAILVVLFYFVFSFVSVIFGENKLSEEEFEFCPPKTMIEPCECHGSNIRCFGRGAYNISEIFARISASNHSHSYNFMTWRIFETDGIIPDHIFAECSILDFEIYSNTNSFIREISPSAFVDYEGRNNGTTYVGLDIATVVPHHDIINAICSQISNLETLYLSLKYDVYEEPK